MNYRHSYLIRLQYLGFRVHGWQKQPNLKTIHLFVDKTIKFIYKGIRFKTIGVGRTDAKVSSTDFAFQLFLDDTLDLNDFIELFNLNSPADVKAVSIEKVEDANFNIIQHPKEKEYRYYFSHGEKNHPYSAPFLVGYLNNLDIEKMQLAAKLFEGEHDFTNYCKRPNEATKVIRTINSCEIIKNTELTASFFPKVSYVLVVKGSGFMRNQIRLIMGALERVGSGVYDLEFIQKSLEKGNTIEMDKVVAPASGLHLHKINFENDLRKG
ncbi:tRNA pseudouridine(38-40) synthase TruA [uncultured Tenacibaculum sp.]|uniref:tRNA pseudouridine synthase A n=1 Tax=uncultured Tenacibaculum sp. TaxID=174713 RepID=UPI002622AAFE|nr:tRNA pseudouridine(38-40) synthase TruA [uncultured Tenacibaculum sp.]